MISTGIHELLATAPPPGEPTSTHAPTSFPLRAELGRQLRRRRTWLTMLLLGVMPPVLVVAFALGDDEGASGVGLVDAATSGALSFALFVAYVSSTFLVVVVAALFAGDAVSSEASWSSLRYLLAAPVRRGRLLRQKWIVAVGSIAAALTVLFASSLAAGSVAFGWGPVPAPSGAVFDAATGLPRLALVAAYLFVVSLLTAGLAFLLGTWTDAPLAAVGGATLLMIVSSILDQVAELGVWRQLLPTHYQLAWTDALHPEIVWDTMLRGAFVSVCYTALLLAASWWHFLRKDVVS